MDTIDLKESPSGTIVTVSNSSTGESSSYGVKDMTPAEVSVFPPEVIISMAGDHPT